MSLIVHKQRQKSKELSWNSWKWQLQNSITDIETFELATGIKFDNSERQILKQTTEKFPLSITPYYLSLIDIDNYKNDPIYKQAFPSQKELIIEKYDMTDPLSEDRDSPVRGVVHRYPDRVLFCVSNTCAMYCRHCTRKRKVGQKDLILSKITLMKALEYIKDHSEIRDVILSGGDPLLLPDHYIDWLLNELKKIRHIEIIRIGTRVPVVLPQRITKSLIKVLKKHSNIWINTQFNHSNEITKDSTEAVKKLSNIGIPVSNQSVLLAGVNDCPKTMKNLLQSLVKNRVRPYYLYQCDLSEGLSHFRTPISKGMEIMESLRGHTSGLCIPTYVVDSPNGGGKIPVSPNYVVSQSYKKLYLRNFEGKMFTYNEPEKYQNSLCNPQCQGCNFFE